MEPIDIVTLCAEASTKGISIPKEGFVPRPFGRADYQNAWRLEPRRFRRLLDDLLCGRDPAVGLALLQRFDVLPAILPEISALRDLGDADGLHKDVWEHTLGVVSKVPADLELRWSALLHDVGKVATRRIERGKVTFHNHDVVGARIVDGIQRRIDLFQDDVALRRTVKALVLNHLRPASYKATWSDSAVRRMLNDCTDPGVFEKLMQLSRADLTTKVPAKRTRCMARADELEQRVARVRALDSAPRLPKGTMGIVIEMSGRTPGPWLNEARERLEAQLADGSLPVDMPATWYADVCLKTDQR